MIILIYLCLDLNRDVNKVTEPKTQAVFDGANWEKQKLLRFHLLIAGHWTLQVFTTGHKSSSLCGEVTPPPSLH